MKHEEAVLRLTDFLQENLSGRIQDEMSAHLANCRECQELAETCLGLASMPREGSARACHPTPDEIALDTVWPAALSGPARARIALHLRDCVSCREEVETARAAHGEIGQLERPPAAGPAKEPALKPEVRLARRHADRRVTWMTLVAVSSLLLLAGYSLARLVASRELRESRAAIERMTTDMREARAWSGPVTLTVLTGDDRSDGPGKTVRVAPGQPYVPLAALPPLPGEEQTEKRYRFEIVSATEETVWSLEMAGDAVRDQAAASGVVSFLVPSASLPPGRYAFRVVGLDTDPGRQLLKSSFTVQ